MSIYKNTVWCDGCGIEILWIPHPSENLHYCCQTCKNGFKCECQPETDEEEERLSRTPPHVPTFIRS